MGKWQIPEINCTKHNNSRACPVLLYLSMLSVLPSRSILLFVSFLQCFPYTAAEAYFCITHLPELTSPLPMSKGHHWSWQKDHYFLVCAQQLDMSIQLTDGCEPSLLSAKNSARVEEWPTSQVTGAGTATELRSFTEMLSAGNSR